MREHVPASLTYTCDRCRRTARAVVRQVSTFGGREEADLAEYPAGWINFVHVPLALRDACEKHIANGADLCTACVAQALELLAAAPVPEVPR